MASLAEELWAETLAAADRLDECVLLDLVIARRAVAGWLVSCRHRARAGRLGGAAAGNAVAIAEWVTSGPVCPALAPAAGVFCGVT